MTRDSFGQKLCSVILCKSALMIQQFFSKNSGEEIMSTSDGRFWNISWMDYDFSSVCLKVFFLYVSQAANKLKKYV
jgi:hypothetical protein